MILLSSVQIQQMLAPRESSINGYKHWASGFRKVVEQSTHDPKFKCYKPPSVSSIISAGRKKYKILISLKDTVNIFWGGNVYLWMA